MGDVLQRLGQDLLAPLDRRRAVAPLLAQRVASVLGLDDVAQLVERQTEEVLQAQQLLEALDAALGVGGVRAGVALGARRQQAELLVVADRPRRRARAPGEVADPQPGGGRGRHAAARSSARATAASSWDGRSSETTAPTADVAASTHSATCMFEMNGSSCASERPVARPEKIWKRTSFGT